MLITEWCIAVNRKELRKLQQHGKSVLYVREEFTPLLRNVPGRIHLSSLGMRL